MNQRPRHSVVVLPCTVVLIAAISFALAERSKPAQTRSLTLAERVAYQRAIEEVYWRHRTWPNEHTPKPSLDQVMSQTQIEKKVADYLRNSQLLENYWQRSLTAEQLQTEMDRMAQHTKQPEVLRELFAVLGNDPFLIAECLARPAVVERLVTNWYAYDQRFHREVKQRAEAELKAYPTVEQMKQMNASYSEIEFQKTDNREAEAHGNGGTVELKSREWDELMRKVAGEFRAASGAAAGESVSQVKTGIFSALRENQSAYYATAVIQKTENRVKLARVQWAKEIFESWRNKAQPYTPTVIGMPAQGYTLPALDDEASGCSDDTWTPTDVPAIARAQHTAVWTGSEMIVWGGLDLTSGYLATGGRYNPSTDTWTATSTTNGPSARYLHTAIWTGSEMIVWGGINNSGLLNTGARYNPNTDVWTSTSALNAPSARTYHTAIWSGREMIVWGGADINNSNGVNSGGRYNPSADTWTSTSTVSAPEGRRFHTAVRAGALMVVWGGSTPISGRTNTGGRYNPPTDSWGPTSTINAPVGRDFHSAVWTGTEMIVWGGLDISNNQLNSGGKYNALMDTWTPTSTINAADGRSFHTAVWTGSEMIVWGGFNGISYLNTGGKYTPSTNSWVATETINSPSGRYYHTAIWSGSEMIVWGGANIYVQADGARYDPLIDGWTPVGNAPAARTDHTAVWTGTEMIVWGGAVLDIPGYSNTGGKYSPSTDTWIATATANAPDARYYHSAIWTGGEMIVWGGNGNGAYLNSGGRYNPGADSWTATSTINAPDKRGFHTAIWTATEMIVWGGYFYDGSDNYLNTGARYNPGADTWTATSTTNAPHGRYGHRTIWTGNEMILWGGYYFDTTGAHYLSTGGRYNPTADSWTATSTTNAPDARLYLSGIWTGIELIVWGGVNNGGNLNSGGRYNPGADSWTATSTTNVPDARYAHTGIWTGNEMIIWGGDGNGGDLNSGGRYNPGADSWTATSMTDAPVARRDHTGIWTGNEMIVWGGAGNVNAGNTGGRYCAAFASPTPTPTPSPSPSPTPTPAPVRVTVAAAPTQINEGQSSTYTVTASSTVTQSTVVSYAMSGTATRGTDYSLTGTAGQVTIPAGQSSGTVTLKAKIDSVTEGTETAIITLQPGSGYRVGNPKQAMVSILDRP